MGTFLSFFDESLLNSLFRFTTPVLLAAMGGILCDRVNLINIALEGMILIGGFTAVVGEYFSGNPWIGVLSGCIGATILALIYAFITITLKGEVVVAGIATNMLASGATTFLLREIFHVKGQLQDPRLIGLANLNLPVIHDIPILGPLFSGHTGLVYLSWVLLILLNIMLFRTPLGLRMRGVGERPLASETLGVKVNALRYLAILISGVFCGLAGSQLAIGIVNVFVENMVGGRGFIALVGVMLGQANPLGVFIACMFFGLVDSIGIRLQGLGMASQITSMLPYVITLLAFGLVRLRQKKQRSLLS